MKQSEPLICSLGVFAYNEAGNILALLEALTSQELRNVKIAEIIVVSSASTDGTDELVAEYSQSHPQVKLIRQARREGKSSAINLFLAQATSPYLVVISGDVIPAPRTIERLVSAFRDERIGATGGRPVPVNDENTFMGFAVHLLWRLHHRMAMISPKLGEMIAFRKLMESIPAESAVDEASIEAIVRQAGLKLRYIPEAVIHNKGPGEAERLHQATPPDPEWASLASADAGLQGGFAGQRDLFWIMLDELRERPLTAGKVFAVMALEAYSRMLGSWDYHVKKKNPFAWEIANSAKKTKQEQHEE